MKKYLLLLLFIILIKPAQSQIVQDLFFKSWDRSYINPAALTQPGGLKGNVQYNTEMLSGVNTARNGQFQLHSNLGTKHGLGIQLQNQESGILAGTGVGAGYAYKVRLTEEEYLSLGSRFNYFKYGINRAEISNANTSDPVLYGDVYRQSNILISTGLLYQWQELEIGATLPEFLPMENASYYRRNMSFYLGYTFQMPSWSLRPNFYYEHVAALGGWYETSFMASYKEVLSLELSHTSESALRVKGGINYRTLSFGYGYDAGTTNASENRLQKVGHRVYLAYNFGDILQRKKTAATPAAPAAP